MAAIIAQNEVVPFANPETRSVKSQISGQPLKVRLRMLDPVDEQQAVLEQQAVSGKSDDALDLPAGSVLARDVYYDHTTSMQRAARLPDEQQVAVVEGRFHAHSPYDEQ